MSGTSDRLTASWALVAGAVAMGYWFYTLDPLRKARLLHQGSTPPLPPGSASSSGGGGSVPAPGSASPATTDPVTGAAVAAGTPLASLLEFAQVEGLTVTSTTGGGHVPGSLHYQGRAIDAGVSGLSAARIGQVVQDALNSGFRVLRELYTGMGPSGYSSGPHLHISDPTTGRRGVAYQDPAAVIGQTTGGLV